MGRMGKFHPSIGQHVEGLGHGGQGQKCNLAQQLAKSAKIELNNVWNTSRGRCSLRLFISSFANLPCNFPALLCILCGSYQKMAPLDANLG